MGARAKSTSSATVCVAWRSACARLSSASTEPAARIKPHDPKHAYDVGLDSMSDETRQMLVVFGLGVPIAALATYIHFRVLRYLRELKERRKGRSR
jgi:hypothetical protein